MAAKRPHVMHTRMSEQGYSWVSEWAEKTGRDASEVVRAALAVAAKHETEMSAVLGKGGL